jgi:nitrogen fixation/metabolism regulation signal transduction histidine kinase
MRTRFQLYLAAIHLAVLGVAGWQYSSLGLWFFAVEAITLSSWIIGARLIYQAMQPMEFVQSFSDLLHEHEFSARFSPAGQPEMDRLIELYNRMLGELYDERLRLGEQRGFLERFIQASPVGVIILDFDARISLANDAALHFLDVEGEVPTGRRLESLESDLAAALADLDPGDSRLVNWRGFRRLRIEKQEFIDRGFRRLFVLIEELTRLLNESERSAYEKLIRLMSHEVNNTVASTNSLLQSCQTYAPQIDDADREDYSNALKVVIDRNANLNHFMRDFAQVVRLPAPDRQFHDVNDLLDTLEIMFRAQCESHGVQWLRSGDRNLPLVSMDREQMEQALINVIKNALEAIGQDGVLEVATARHEGFVRMVIIDDGAGLEPKAVAELFTPFFTSKAGGQGLGLTLVKEILLQHGFEFSLEPAQDGRTRFTIDMHS